MWVYSKTPVSGSTLSKPAVNTKVFLLTTLRLYPPILWAISSHLCHAFSLLYEGRSYACQMLRYSLRFQAAMLAFAVLSFCVIVLYFLSLVLCGVFPALLGGGVVWSYQPHHTAAPFRGWGWNFAGISEMRRRPKAIRTPPPAWACARLYDLRRGGWGLMCALRGLPATAYRLPPCGGFDTFTLWKD